MSKSDRNKAIDNIKNFLNYDSKKDDINDFVKNHTWYLNRITNTKCKRNITSVDSLLKDSSYLSIDDEMEKILYFIKSYNDNDDKSYENKYIDRIDCEPYHLNFFAIRCNTWADSKDKFTDTFYMFWNTNTKENPQYVGVKTGEGGFTTKAGLGQINGYANKGNAIPIMLEGFHMNIWTLAHHGVSGNFSHPALSQRGTCNPMRIIREKKTKNFLDRYYAGAFKKNRIDSGTNYGINLHTTLAMSNQTTYFGKRTTVGLWSAGCQVFSNPPDQELLITMVEKGRSKQKKLFSYFLIEKTRFDDTTKENVDDNEYTPSDKPKDKPKSESKSESKPKDENPGDVKKVGEAKVNEVGEEVSGDNDITTSTTGDEVNISVNGQTISDEYKLFFAPDNNNRYIDLPLNEIEVVQITRSLLKVDDLNISDKYYVTTGIAPERISFYTPVVFINDFMIPQTNITNFYLDYSSFLPQVMVEFVDMTNELLSTNIPKPGTYIKVYIGAYNDEKYKPIRQDFVITNISKTNKTGGDYQNIRNPLKYKLTGVLNVPLGFNKMKLSNSKCASKIALFDLSRILGLGFATNFREKNNTIDIMNWINNNKNLIDYIKEITNHSCFSPYTFFTSFIDQYYNLNFIECRRLLSHGGKMTDKEQVIYSCTNPNMEENTNNNGGKMEGYYMISNSEEFRGWTNYIEEFYEINDGYSMMSDGYSNIVNFRYKTGLGVVMDLDITIKPVDNLYRKGNGEIKSLRRKISNDTYIPLNLRETTNIAYLDNKHMYDNPIGAQNKISFDTEIGMDPNIFPAYYYASIQNDFQMKCLKKCGLSVRLQNYNPSITRYSRIWVEIYDMHRNSSSNIRKDIQVEYMDESKYKNYLKEKNDDIIIFNDERKRDNENQVFNRSLTGWYVVTDIKISYNTVKDFHGKTSKKLQSQLILNRIEYKPSFYSEYNTARKCVDKLKGDIINGNIQEKK